MIKSFKSFVANESGATAIEYALIASLKPRIGFSNYKKGRRSPGFADLFFCIIRRRRTS
jgi:hypothetical protein